jgi:hypothetical protein
MAETTTPAKVQLAAERGFKRMSNHCAATAMFIKEYVGAYYKRERGLTGEEPINLIFRSIATFVPNLVMQNPVNQVTTDYLEHKMYAELLSLALNSLDRQLKLKEIIRAWITSAFFGWGIIKVGLAAQGEMLQFDDINVDPGQIYAQLVGLDDFTFDPLCTDIRNANFMGHKTMVPRQFLLDADIYNHDLVMRLPKSGSITKQNKIADITRDSSGNNEMMDIQDYVDVVELWIPQADAIVTIPDPEQIRFGDYIGVTDYYGPKEGPYVFLSFTPPVQGNPLPVAPVAMHYDLHRMANRIMTKTMDQADRQKDLLLYNPANVEDAQETIDAKDGDALASSDPKAAQVYSFGGQNKDNVLMLQQLQVWHNYMSGNPDQVAGNMTPGTKGSKETATRSQILQANASISIEDARGLIYDGVGEINRRFAWYLHTDPLINIPLTKRVSAGEYRQLFLTPEQRQGDFLEYTFKIVARSMSKLDPSVRSKRIAEFGTNILPAAANTAMILLQIGVPFNLQRYLTRIADEMGIGEWVLDLFDDPEFQQKMAIYMSMGPQNAGKASENTNEGVTQNQGFPGKRNILGPDQIQNQNVQMTAAEGQAANYGVY